jgi:hypothetical protein
MSDFSCLPCFNIVLLFLLFIAPYSYAQSGRNLDQFNYGSTKGNNYGPKDWGKIQCPDVNTCVSFEKHEYFLADVVVNDSDLTVSRFNSIEIVRMA